MNSVLFVGFIWALCLTVALGQQCKGNFNATFTGQCQAPNDCRGTLLSPVSCEGKRCCINQTSIPSQVGSCLNRTAFRSAYNSTRGAFLAELLDYGIYKAGLCTSCQGKAAFLAIAATMTENFQKDEATGNDASFAADDRRYGNTQAGDGSRFRRRGFFGLRGRGMYDRVQKSSLKFPVISQPELAAIANYAIEIAAYQWRNPDLLTAHNMVQYADGSFYSFSRLW
jgi:uncharacterized protein (DUF2237 family)